MGAAVPVLWPILPAVPRASDATINDLAFAQRTALVGTDIADCEEICRRIEYRNPFPAMQTHDLGLTVRNVIH